MDVNNLKKAIEQSGIKQARIAEIMGVSNNTISRWVTGQFEPSDDKKVMLAEILKVPVSYLMGESGDVEISTHNMVMDKDNKASPPRSETQEMFYRLMQKFAEKNPDIILHFRDLDRNIDKLSPNDIQGLADAFAKLTGETNADIDQRLRKKSRHGDL